MIKTIKSKIFSAIALIIIFSVTVTPKVFAKNLPPLLQTTLKDTPPINLHYPIEDNRGNGMGNTNPFYLKNPSNITDSIAYDPITKRYQVFEKIGSKYYRSTTSYSFEEYWQLKGRQSEIDYFKKRSNTLNILNRGAIKPKLSMYDNLFNRLFGNGKISIIPQGNVDVTAGYQGQNIKNPTLPENARKSGGFDFDMNAQVNVNADIGGKLKFPINYNTLANFGQDNQIKLDYTGIGDEIVKRFELGNVSFPSRSLLIPGSQQLFGIKTQLQFGKLFITGVMGNQKSSRQSTSVQGNAANQLFEVKADEYEENRHFLLSQYFKDNYNKVMAKLPAITTPIQILRLEVWVTNRTGTTINTRDVVGLANLGETNTFPAPIPTNATNSIYASVASLNRNPSVVYNNLISLGLQPTKDFEKVFAKKLDSTQYTWNPKVGFISLAQPLQTDEVLGVAYQYTYNGKVYQVGEFSQDFPPDSTTATQNVLYLKLLKATAQLPTQPIWKLMLKNVYAIGYGTLTPQDFKLDVLFQQPGFGTKRYVPFGDKNGGFPIISLINLDRLNSNNDPQPDGIFDYVEGYTVYSQYSRVMFPVLEPFGRDLANGIYTNPSTSNAKDSLFYVLYDSIKAVAQQYPSLNRFVLKGSAKISGASDINIGYNVPKGSVIVTAGGRTLIEDVDYVINYDLGTLKIINSSIASSGIPVQVSSESNAGFGLQQRNYTGLRLDYMARNTLKEQLTIGGTIVRLGERPYFSKVSYDNGSNGTNEPIRNTMYGLDVNFRKSLPRLTKILDKLPFYKANGASSINAFAEGAYFKPGHSPQIGKGSKGIINIDDFDGSQSSIDLRFPITSWALASVPVGATMPYSNTELFPESALNNNILEGKNRAKIAWYQIESVLQQLNGNNNPFSADRNQLSDPRVRQVYQKEIFPQRTTGFGESQLPTFDLSYYPKERGPYNFDAAVGDVDPATGKLLKPTQRFGGLMRSLDQTDFETANIEFIEFWVQDPFVINNITPGTVNPAGGKLFFNLGNVSEDILKDGKRAYENGLPTPNAPTTVDPSNWGAVPRNPIQVTNAFSNNQDDRPYQDVGLDGLSDTAEANLQAPYLLQLASIVGNNSPAYNAAKKDPSSDDYHHYRGSDYDQQNVKLLTRYKNYNGTEGNSPVASSTFVAAATAYPDAEDLNKDNTLNQTEQYFQYSIDILPPNNPSMQIGTNFIVDKKVVNILPANGVARNETWYQFRIPVSQYDKQIGGISDFKSIRFMRMFMTNFEDSITLRFGELQLTRNIWRQFKYKIDSTGAQTPISTLGTTFSQGAVNIEENDQRSPLPYRTPTAIKRIQTLSSNGSTLLQNEQSLSMQFCNLSMGDARGVFQTFANRDLRSFRKMDMYIHAEKKQNTFLNNKDLTAVVRIGSDFISNYYEIRIPLYLTNLNTTIDPNSNAYNDSLWNPANSLSVDLPSLVKLKEARNANVSYPVNQIYRQLQNNGHTYSVMGNPNLAEIKGALISVENTNVETACGEVWVDEFRLSSIDEQGGWAALGRIDLQLSDLGNVSISGNMHTVGFGTLEQRVNERYRDNYTQFDVATNLALGKLLPKSLAINLPFYASYSQSISKPKFDPYDMDIKLNDKIKNAPANQRDSIRNDAIEFNSSTLVSFTNVHKNKTSKKPAKIYDISNVSVSYAYSKIKNHTPLIESNEIVKHHYNLIYDFAPKPKYYEPFKRLFKKNKSHWFDLVKDFNFNLIPSHISFNADVNRQFAAIRPRSIGASKYAIPETFDKYYTFKRDYLFTWSITKSLNFDFSAHNSSVIDQPNGRLDTREKKDTVRNNLYKGGRSTIYTHAANFTYMLPTKKFPLIDWTSVNLNYGATYTWTAASRLAIELGNFIENTQSKGATANLDFNQLYQKSKWLRQLEQPSNKEDRERWRKRITIVKDSVMLKSGKKVLKTHRIIDKSAMPYVGTFGKIVGKLFTSLKQVNVSVSEDAFTRLPGYTDSTKYVGQNWKSMAPGIDFLMGKQPDTSWLNQAAKKGLITKDTSFNYLFAQGYNQHLTLTAQIEPVRDLNITVNWSKTFSKNYSETFRYVDTTGGTNRYFQHLNPYAGGSFDVTYIAFGTLFDKYNPNKVSATFRKFEDYRSVLSARLGKINPNSTAGGTYIDAVDGKQYSYGYGRYATDVLIPAFIAAYTGKNPNSVALINQSNPNTKSNPFKSIMPKPNWRLDYNGLSRVKGFDKIFTSFTLSHGYVGNLSMNGFNSALFYQSKYNMPSFYDARSKNYIPYFLIPNISIGEQFAPLIGIDMMFKNQFQAKVEYSKSRNLSLSLIDYQLSEVRSSEFSIGLGYKKRGLKMPFKLPKILNKDGGKKIQNEMAFRFDFKIRDNITANSKLDDDINFSTGGSKEIYFKPTIDYILNNRINVQLFFEQRKIIPYISSSSPITYTKAGIQIRISLAQ